MVTSRLTGTQLTLTHCLLSLCSQNEVTPYDVAKLHGHQDVCDLLQDHTNSETDKEITEVRWCVCVSSVREQTLCMCTLCILVVKISYVCDFATTAR